MRHAKSRCRSEHSDISELVEDADESAPVRLQTAPTVLPFGRRCFQLCRFTPPRHLPGSERVYLFFKFTIIRDSDMLSSTQLATEQITPGYMLTPTLVGRDSHLDTVADIAPVLNPDLSGHRMP